MVEASSINRAAEHMAFINFDTRGGLDRGRQLMLAMASGDGVRTDVPQEGYLRTWQRSMWRIIGYRG